MIVVPLSTRATEHELADRRSRLRNEGAVLRARSSRTFAVVDSQFPVTHRIEDIGAEPPTAQHDTASEDIYCLLYTSGTTGKPKGVMIPKRQLCLERLQHGRSTGDLRDDDVTPIFTPMYHAGGSGGVSDPDLLHRRDDRAAQRRSSRPRSGRRSSSERCTVVLGVPTIWKLLMDAPDSRPPTSTHVRWFISGGAPLPQYIIEPTRSAASSSSRATA